MQPTWSILDVPAAVHQLSWSESEPQAGNCKLDLTILTCKGKSVLLLLSVLNTLSSIQDFGVSDGVERVNFGGAITLPENGFFSGDI